MLHYIFGMCIKTLSSSEKNCFVAHNNQQRPRYQLLPTFGSKRAPFTLVTPLKQAEKQGLEAERSHGGRPTRPGSVGRGQNSG